MAQCLTRLGYMAYFSLNRVEIIEKYCINKSNPESCCMGKCYLSKQLTGNEKEKNNQTRITELEIPYFMLPDNTLGKLVMQVNLTKYCAKDHSTSSGFCSLTKQPPKSIV